MGKEREVGDRRRSGGGETRVQGARSRWRRGRLEAGGEKNLLRDLGEAEGRRERPRQEGRGKTVSGAEEIKVTPTLDTGKPTGAED